MLRVNEREVLALLTSVPGLAWVGAGRYGWGDVGSPAQPTYTGSAGLRLFNGAWGLVSFNYDENTRYAGNVILDNWTSTSFSDTYVWVTHERLADSTLVEPSVLGEYGGFAPAAKLTSLRYGNGTAVASSSRRSVTMLPPYLQSQFLCAVAYSEYPTLSNSYGSLNGLEVPYSTNNGTGTTVAVDSSTMRIGSESFSSTVEPKARTRRSAMFAGARYTGQLPKSTCRYLSAELSRMFNKRRDFIFVPVLFAGAGGAPTITALSTRLITTTSAQPRISYS